MIETDEIVSDGALSAFIPERAAFFDIETTGLSSKTGFIYLLGLTYQTENVWHCHQWFIEEQSEEQKALIDLANAVKPFETLITFNGNTFDLPFVKSCAQQYHLETGFEDKSSLDLYKEFKRYAGLLNMKKQRQKDYEERLGIFREDKYSGKELIDIYHRYQENRSEELLHLLLLHNREDCKGMLEVSRLLRLDSFFKGDFSVLNYEYPNGEGSFRLILKSTVSVPVDFFATIEDISLKADGDNLELLMPVSNGKLRYFFDNYEDYFYLPLEDTAVHKSIGAFVDKKCRQKASKKTAYQWIAAELILNDNSKLNSFLKALFRRYIGV